MSVASSEDHHHHQKKKRVGKACDSCRIKKTKCDGKSPCSRCVANNKICAFVHKKKNRDKVHPSGYIEMLETRIDILTKSLKRLMVLSEPHLPFLQEIIENAKHDQSPVSSPMSDGNSEDEFYIPINEVVSYLVSNRELAHINSDSDPRSPDQDPEPTKSISIKTEEGLADADSKEQLLTAIEQVPILSSNGVVKVKAPTAIKIEPDSANLGDLDHSRCSSSASIFSPHNELMRGSIGEDLESLSKADSSNSSTQDSLNMNSGLDMKVVPGLDMKVVPGLDMNVVPGLDANFESGLELNSTMSAVDIFPRRSNSMFISNYTPYSTSQSPVSSLSNKLESHYLDESSIHSIRRSVSQKSHQRKNSGHVHKPSFFSHSHVNSSSNSFLANNGNVFQSSSSKSMLSPDTLPSEVDGYSQEDIKRINDEDYFSLASEKIMNQPPSQCDPSSYLDADLLSNNPFLS